MEPQQNHDVSKDRTASAGSSASSITEYVNEVFVESELEMSKVVSVHVQEAEFVKNPSAHETMEGDVKIKIPKALQNVSGSSSHAGESATESIVGRFFPIRKMYLATLAVLIFPINMGFTATYTATATDNMKGPHSSIHPNSDQVTWIVSLMALGALFGGTAAGYFSNSLGRKGALIFNTVMFVTGWLLVAYAPSIGYIYAGRLITGFCCGILSVATPLYLVEIATPEVRGLLGASFQLFVVLGILIVTGLGSVLTWRWLAISGAVVSLTAAFFMVPMPESPVWLMARRRRGEAKNGIVFLQGKGFDANSEIQMIEEEIKSQPVGTISFRDFKAPSVYKPFILSILLMFFQQFSGVNAILSYTVDIFKAARTSLDAKTSTLLVAIMQVLATLLSSLLMDRSGRKILLIISGICMAVSLSVFGSFQYVARNNPNLESQYGWLPVICLMAFIAAFSIGFGPTPWLMTAEMTPSRYRSIVSGVATALNWFFVFTITKTYKAMEESMHDYAVYSLYASFCAISCFVTYFFLPETKGKQIEEIQEYFEPKKC